MQRDEEEGGRITEIPRGSNPGIHPFSMEYDKKTEQLPVDTIPSRAASFCGFGPSVPLSTSNIRRIRTLALLIVVSSIIEFGIGGAANHTFRRTVGVPIHGAWWGSLFALFAGLVALICTTERRLWVCFMLSNIGALVAFVGSIVEGIASVYFSSISTVGSVQNVTAMDLYTLHGNSWATQSSKIQNSAVLYFGAPNYKNNVFNCIQSLPKDDLSPMGMSDDAVAACAQNPSTRLPCIASATAYRYQSNACYLFTNVVSGVCGRGDLQLQEGKVDLQGCNVLLSGLPDFVIGSTALLTMICFFSILLSFHLGTLYYQSVKDVSSSRESTVGNPVASAGGLGGSV